MITAYWTPPPAPPSNGYRITVDSEDFSAGIDTMSSSQTISVSPGVHTIRVQSRSIHFPGGIAAGDITVLGINVTNNKLLATTILFEQGEPHTIVIYLHTSNEVKNVKVLALRFVNESSQTMTNAQNNFSYNNYTIIYIDVMTEAVAS